MVKEAVQIVVTPGETVDAIVTDRGIAINPKRLDLIDNLRNADLPIMSIYELKNIAYKLTGKPEPIRLSDEVVGVVEYRDGTVIDVIRRPFKLIYFIPVKKCLYPL